MAVDVRKLKHSDWVAHEQRRLWSSDLQLRDNSAEPEGAWAGPKGRNEMEEDLGRDAEESTDAGRPFRNLSGVQARSHGVWTWDVTVGGEGSAAVAHVSRRRPHGARW